MGEPPALCPDVPEPLDRLWRQMVAKQPEDRFATPGEVAQQLGTWSAVSPPAIHLPVPIGPRPAGPLVVIEATKPFAAKAVVAHVRRVVEGRRFATIATRRAWGWCRQRLSRRKIIVGSTAMLAAVLALAVCTSWKEEQVFLSDLPEKVIQVETRADGGFAKGKEGKDRPDWTAPTIRVHGLLFYKGLFTEPNAQVEYQLDQRYRRFQAKVAVIVKKEWASQYKTLRATVDFSVTGDGTVLWRSKAFSLPSKQDDDEVDETPFLDVRKVRVLHLVVNTTATPFIGQYWWYKCYWLDPRLTK